MPAMCSKQRPNGMLVQVTRTDYPTTSAGYDAFLDRFGRGAEPRIVSVPGRVNLIGEHIDYHDLAVLPIAIGRRTSVLFRPIDDNRVNAVSAGHADVSFSRVDPFRISRFGDWGNYIRAASAVVNSRWRSQPGIEALVVSDLPQAAGLSPSTALLVGFTLALL